MASALNRRVAARIRHELADRDRGQTDLAALLGWGEVFLSRRLTGRVELNLAEVEAIASALQLPIRDLLDAPIPPVFAGRLAG